MSSVGWVKNILCPACGHYGTIFLAAENYLTCSVDTCPNPDYAEALEAKIEAEKKIAAKQGGIDALRQLRSDYTKEQGDTDKPRELVEILNNSIAVRHIQL